ncbi:tetratricopeptide repeat protein [Tunicatimonas pelagia]|uniref:tetratricopeptide repeat protein n=1 Tax=Tunicatimonas pelagia TaxID=931531 RepID=UPI00266589BA|nr:tetratricopeptide repeat protein [Tunicatimonas pelagia]WKN42161.1 tetratricopeptide repeat protein [Tunicatimonas pelagia]
MRAFFLFSVIAFTVTLPSFAQPEIEEADSLRKLLSTQVSNSDRVEVLYRLMYAYTASPQRDSIQYYANALLKHIHIHGAETLPYQSITQGFLALSQQHYDTALMIFQQADLYFAENKNHWLQFSLYDGLGSAYEAIEDWGKAGQSYERSIQPAQYQGDSTCVAYFCFNTARMYAEQEQSASAADLFLRALTIETERENFPKVAKINYAIGTLFSAQVRWKEAEKYFLEALEMAERIQYYEIVGASLNILAVQNKQQQNYQKAEEYYQRALRIAQQIGNPNFVAIAWNNLGSLSIAEGDLEKAKIYLQRSLALADSANVMQRITLGPLLNLGDVAFQQRHYAQARLYYGKTLALAKTIDRKESMIEASQKLTELYEVQGDFEQALAMQQQYTALKDSLQSETSQQHLNQLEVKYQTLQKTQEIAQLTEAAKIKNLQTSRQAALIAILLLSLGMVGGMLFWQRRQARLKQQFAILQARQNERDAISRKIAMDFHDELSNELTSIAFMARHLNTYASSSVGELTQKIEKIANNLHQGTRDFIWLLDPNHMYLDQVYTHLIDVGSEWFLYADAQFSADTPTTGMKQSLPSGWGRHIFLIFKEALQNIRQHAQAEHVQLQATLEGNQVQIVLTDDGKGFTNPSRKSGLNHMQRRANKIEADLTICSQPNQGTTITLLCTIQPSIITNEL